MQKCKGWRCPYRQQAIPNKYNKFICIKCNNEFENLASYRRHFKAGSCSRYRACHPRAAAYASRRLALAKAQAKANAPATASTIFSNTEGTACVPVVVEPDTTTNIDPSNIPAIADLSTAEWRSRLSAGGCFQLSGSRAVLRARYARLIARRNGCSGPLPTGRDDVAVVAELPEGDEVEMEE